MNRRSCIGVTILLLCVFSVIAFSDAGQRTSGSYYDQLNSLLSRRSFFSKIVPNASGRDVNLIEIEQGAAGVLFGASMDDVVAVWGKPTGIVISQDDPVWDLEVGTCSFGFLDDRLVRIRVTIEIEKAHLPNGIGFQSSYEEIKAAFGEPEENPRLASAGLEYMTENGYRIDFSFLSTGPSGELKLLSIGIQKGGYQKGMYRGQRIWTHGKKGDGKHGDSHLLKDVTSE